MYIDPMGAILMHRLETERAVAMAERRRVVAERDAERRSSDDGARRAPASVEGGKRMAKFGLFRLFRLAS